MFFHYHTIVRYKKTNETFILGVKKSLVKVVISETVSLLNTYNSFHSSAIEAFLTVLVKLLGP